MRPSLCLRIDIDTYWGCREGVPALRRVLDEMGVCASFFAVTGRDSAGLHVKRLKKPGYVARLRHVGVLETLHHLHWRSMLYGTLLPGPLVAEGQAGLLRSLEADGHEIGLHGYDHAGWAEGIERMDARDILTQWERGRSSFVRALGHTPMAHAAPNWCTSELALRLQESAGLAYASDVRGTSAFYPFVNGRSLATLQLPVTLPCAHELLVNPGMAAVETPDAILRALCPESLNVWCLHDWFEGLRYPDIVRAVVRGALSRGYEVLPLCEQAVRCVHAPSCLLTRTAVPGGVGRVSAQGTRVC